MKDQKHDKKGHIVKTELAVGEMPKKERRLAAPEKPHRKEEKAPEKKEKNPEHHAAKKGLFRGYLQSWKETASLTFLLIIIADLALYVLIVPSFYGYGYFVKKLAEPFQGIDASSIAAQSAEQLGVYQQSFINLLVFAFLLGLLFMLLLAAVWSLSRAFIWTRLLGKKLSWRYIWKFCLLNLVWMLFCAVVFMLFSLFFYKTASASKAGGIIGMIAALLLLLIMVYLMYILYFRFTEGESRIWRSFREMFVLGVKRFPRLALPLLLAIATIAVAAAVSLVFKLLPKIAMDMASYVLFFGVFAWVKVYAAEVLKERV